MRKESLLQNYFKGTFSFMHKKREDVLFGAVDSLMSGASLSLTSLGRGFKGKAKERHQIRKMDRLLGNKHLPKEIPHIYQKVNQLTLCTPNPILCVDWSCLSYADEIYLLRASVKIKGRSLVCYQEVHPKKHENNEQAHNLFLDRLKEVIPDNITPIVVTDAVFSPLWFNKVRSLHWHFVGRVRANRGNYFYKGRWGSVKEAYELATTTPLCLGDILLTEKNKLPCRIVTYKKIPKGRTKKNAKGQLAKGSYEKVQSKANKEPWLLVTSLSQEEASAEKIVLYYSYRMQIEEEFRDTKSPLYGFGFSHSRTKIHARIQVLLIINMLASIFCWVIACDAIKNRTYRNYHANSSKKVNILSAITLGKRIYRKITNFSVYHFKTAFNYWIKLIKGEIIYGDIL